jgi:hypothetical protein
MNLKYYKMLTMDDRFPDQEMVEVEPANGDYLLKAEVQPIIDAYEKMIAKLIEYKNDARQSCELRIKNTDTYVSIYAIPKRKLPLHINIYEADTPEHHLISCRLSGDDPFEKDLAICMKLLYDEEFDVYTYKNIGYTDGSADTTASLLALAGLINESNQASEAVYSSD